MSFNWKAIESYEDAEVAHYRLLGEMLRRRADLADLDKIRAFLLKAELASDGWLGLGEALHRTTNGSPVGYDIWLAWLSTYEDVDVDEERLGGKWMEFSEELSEAEEEFDPKLDLLPAGHAGVEAPTTMDELPSAASVDDDDEYDDDSTSMMAAPVLRAPVTGVLAESPTQLLRMVPIGPFQLRIFNQEFTHVDEYTVLTLIKRGLFLGAEVRFGPGWVPAWEHPAFEAISQRLQAEAVKILTRTVDTSETGPLS